MEGFRQCCLAACCVPVADGQQPWQISGYHCTMTDPLQLCRSTSQPCRSNVSVWVGILIFPKNNPAQRHPGLSLHRTLRQVSRFFYASNYFPEFLANYPPIENQSQPTSRLIITPYVGFPQQWASFVLPSITSFYLTHEILFFV